MMVYSIKNILEKAQKEAQEGGGYSVIEEESFINALGLVKRALIKRGVAIVQGPPGTGKTTVFVDAVREMINRLNEGELIIYVAPTNKLVAQMLGRVAGTLFRHGYRREELLNMVRVYGSQFDYTECEKLSSNVDKNVRIVFATEYQRVSGRDFNTIHFLIDEASRSKLHKPFITTARDIIEKLERGEGIYGSISVVGDPMQAIVLGERYWKWRHIRVERLVIEEFTRSLLELKGIESIEFDPHELMIQAYDHLRGEYFELLKLTYRLPSPTEIPISEGYYGGRLEARFSARERLKGMWLGKNPLIDDELLKKVYRIVENAITSNLPLIIVEPIENHEYASEGETGVTYDEIRAKLSIAFALALAYTTEKETYVIAPYRDQILQTKLNYARRYGSLARRLGLEGLIEFTTVQKMLGSEADNVVAVLGKEHHGDLRQGEPTIYFQEPELLNVQLSRHRRILVVIGNLRKLYKEAGKANQELRERRYHGIRITVEKMLSFADIDPQSNLPRNEFAREGNAAIYWRYGA